MKRHIRFYCLLSLVLSFAVLMLITLLDAGRQKPIASESRCRRQLKGIYEGISGCHHIKSRFPVGTTTVQGLLPIQRSSWLAEICGFFAYGPIELMPPDEIGVSRPSYRGHLEFLRCPHISDPDQPTILGLTNYVGIAGLGIDSPTFPISDSRSGVFGYERIVTISDIKDGLSNTAMVSETSMEIGPWIQGGSATIRGLNTSARPYVGKGRQFGGIHGGTMTLFADGSVRSVSEKTSHSLFESLFAIHGKENIGPE